MRAALLLAALLPFVLSVGGAPTPIPVTRVTWTADTALVTALRGTTDFVPYWTSSRFAGRRYVLTTLPLDSSRGFILKAHRIAFGPLMADGYLSQADLAALAHVSTTKISRVERGLDSLTGPQQDSIASAFVRVMRARVHPYAMEEFNAIVLSAMRRP